jgi:flagellin-like hook-associated protein FlgL
MADVNLSKAVRSNLLSLQSTAANMAKTQNKLATGLKVNSALDNPTNFFTAAALNSRAGDMGNLLDGMSNGISTIEAADNGLKSITKTVESMQSAIRQARQDKSFKGESLSLSGGTAAAAGVVTIDTDAAGSTAAVSFSLASGSRTGTGGVAQTGGGNVVFAGVTGGSVAVVATDTLQQVADKINADTDVTGAGFTASLSGGQLKITNTKGSTVDLTGSTAQVLTDIGLAATGTSTVESSFTVDQLASTINSTTSVNTKVRASNDNGKLRIENLQTSTAIRVGGLNSSGAIDQTAAGSSTKDVGENTVRADLIRQFNDLRQQLDRTSEDASFNGINLLRGDALKLTFNETGSSSLTVQAKDGKAINATNLGVDAQNNTVADTDAGLDAVLTKLGDALNSLRSQSSAFGSNLSMVENRQDFTKNMINTLETGAGNLTLADTNEEAANLLALQTRQQLSSTALSMASQADQAVLRLF